MTEESKAPEHSSQPTKRGRRAWLIALAVVVAVVTIALLANAPKPEPVKVWFVRATNEAGVKKLVFEGTNGVVRDIEFDAALVTGALEHPQTSVPSPSIVDRSKVWPAKGTNFAFVLNAPPKDVPYYVVWEFHDIDISSTRSGRLRARCWHFFHVHSMPALARPFVPKLELHYIPSTEIKE